jgi:hypothetical protein
MDPITLTIPFPGFYESALSAELDRAEEQLIGYLTGKGDYASDEPEFPNVSEQDAAEALMNVCNRSRSIAGSRSRKRGAWPPVSRQRRMIGKRPVLFGGVWLFLCIPALRQRPPPASPTTP